MNQSSLSTRAKRPGGRSARVRAAVLRATLDLLDEHDGLPKIEAVAKRAAVQKTSIYRRWGTPEALAFDAVQSTLPPHAPIPDTGTLRADLLCYMRDSIDFQGTEAGGMLTRLMVHAPEETRRAYWQERFAAAITMVQRAQNRREIGEEIDATALVEMLLAPLFWRRVVTGVGLDMQVAERWVDMVLFGTV